MTEFATGTLRKVKASVAGLRWTAELVALAALLLPVLVVLVVALPAGFCLSAVYYLIIRGWRSGRGWIAAPDGPL
jgi:hypothetical protein